MTIQETSIPTAAVAGAVVVVVAAVGDIPTTTTTTTTASAAAIVTNQSNAQQQQERRQYNNISVETNIHSGNEADMSSSSSSNSNHNNSSSNKNDTTGSSYSSSTVRNSDALTTSTGSATTTIQPKNKEPDAAVATPAPAVAAAAAAVVVTPIHYNSNGVEIVPTTTATNAATAAAVVATTTATTTATTSSFHVPEQQQQQQRVVEATTTTTVVGSSDDTLERMNAMHQRKHTLTNQNNNNNSNNHYYNNNYSKFKSLAAAVSSSSSLSSQSSSHPHRNQILTFRRTTTIAIIGLCTLYTIIIYKTQHVLDQHEQYFTNLRMSYNILNHNNNILNHENNNQNMKSSSILQQQQQQMIPISPLNFITHPVERKQKQLILQKPSRQQQQQQKTTPLAEKRKGEGVDQMKKKISTTSAATTLTKPDIRYSREPHQYLQYLQRQVSKVKTIVTSTKSRSLLLQSSTTTNVNTTTTTTTTNNSTGSRTIITDSDRFIIYDADLSGQGTGNIIAGLLAAHLLGDEFHRIVCINPIYTFFNFFSVFEYVNPIAMIKCPLLFQQQEKQEQKHERRNDVSLINYAGAADECYLQNIMSDQTKQTLYIVANTYPRWPTVPNNYFLYYYQPTSLLLDALPYTNQPNTVVHLRQPDDDADQRAGLDPDSLNALGQLLPKNESTFLVTNNVAFYPRFDECCHWSHPKWRAVKHSALEFVWRAPEDAGIEEESDPINNDNQFVQMWVDWYTLLMADDVYHTHSDFSISAVHWMNKKDHSFSIKGYNPVTKELERHAESWWLDGETIPMIQRTLVGKPGTTNELRACSEETRQTTELLEKKKHKKAEIKEVKKVA